MAAPAPFCGECGQQNLGGKPFCLKCGTRHELVVAGADGFRVLIKIVAHKTKQLPPAAQALSSDSDSAEAEQFLTTRALCTPLKVAKHLGCDVEDLIHLNTVRYPAISGPRIQLQQKTRLLKPFRSRTVQGLVVAHNGSDQNERLRLAALDPDGVNMPGDGITGWVDDTVPENICFEFVITRTQLDDAKVDDTVFGPVRLDAVADQWDDDDATATAPPLPLIYATAPAPPLPLPLTDVDATAGAAQAPRADATAGKENSGAMSSAVRDTQPSVRCSRRRSCRSPWGAQRKARMVAPVRCQASLA